MPWEKTFDIDEAVDRATDVFWAKGYKATSLADLIEATGVNKGSFYNAFGSKKKLFTTCLLKYEREQRSDVFKELEGLHDPYTAVSRLFDLLLAQSAEDTEKKGCFLVNTALDLPNHDEDIQKTVKKGLKGTESFFEGQIRSGIDKGLISKQVDPENESKSLLTLLIGFRVLSRGVFDQGSLSAIKAKATSLFSE